MSIKSIKEKQLLVNLAKSFGQEVDISLVEDVEKHKQIENKIRQNIRSNIFDDLSKALIELEQEADKVSIENNYPLPPSLNDIETNFPLPPSLEELETLIQEEEKANDVVQEETEEEPAAPTLTDLASEAISASAKRDSFQQPDPLLVAPDVVSIQKKIRYLEQWIAKVSQAGPGGGAGDVINLDHPVKLVNNNYTITRKDYYIGVNATSPVTITLPDAIGFPGRKVAIKDESGNCSSNPITVLGNVDNDPGGFILQMDNGGIQMIYREGWRII